MLSEETHIVKIKELLTVHPKGMTTEEIAKSLPLNRTSTAKYLNTLVISGLVEIHRVGPAKNFTLTRRVPVSQILSLYPDPVILVDHDRIIKEVNPRFLTVFTLSREDLIGKKFETTLLSTDIKSFLLPSICHAVAGQESINTLKVMLGDRELFFKSKYVPVVFDDGLPGAGVILDDITKSQEYQQNLEREVKERTGELRNTNQRLEEEIKAHENSKSELQVLDHQLARNIEELQMRQFEREQQHEELIRAKSEAVELLDKYIDLYDNAPVGYFTLDAGGVILAANKCGMTRLSPYNQPLTGRRFEEFLSEESIPVFSAFCKCIMMSDRPEVSGIELVSPDGQAPWYAHVEGRVERDKRDDTVQIRLTLSDITDRKRAEHALQENLERYQGFFRTSRDCVFITSKNGDWIDFNDAAVELFGYSDREELMKVKIPDLYARSEDRNEHIRMVAELGFTKECPVDLVKKDGTKIHTLITSVARHDDRGNVIGFQGTIRDITERKKAEDALRESEARMNSIFHGSPLLQFVIDRNHRVVLWNRAMAEYSGITAESVMGTGTHWKAFYPEPRPCLADLLVDEAVEQLPEWYERKIGKSRVIEGAYEAIDFFPDMGDNGRWLYFTAAPFRDASGTIIGAFETLVDVTDRRQVEQQQQLALDVLHTLNHTMDDTQTIRDILSAIQRSSGIEAVGIRLRDGDNFPYAEAIGFSTEFVRHERSRHTGDHPGCTGCDSGGTAGAACLCGRVINQNTDLQFPFFTRGGSFWTNSLTGLQLTTPDAELRSGMCNTCSRAGYESIALIPLRSQGKTIGLLQLNDSRKNRFNPQMIDFFEGLGNTIGISVDHRYDNDVVRKSEERFRGVTERISDIILLTDGSGRATYVSPSIQNVLGYSPGELVGKNLDEFIPAPYTGTVWTEFEKNMAGTVTDCPEVQVRKKGGEYAIMEIAGSPIRDGGKVVGAQIVWRDFTARRTAEKERDLSTAMYQGIFANTLIGVCHILPGGRILRANDKAAQILGYDSGDDLVSSVTDISRQICENGKTREDLAEALDEKGFIENLELPVYRRDGRQVWVLIAVREMPNPDGSTCYHEVLFHDITALKETENGLRQAHQQLSLINTITRNDILQSTVGMLENLTFAKTKHYDPKIHTLLEKLESSTNVIRSHLEATQECGGMDIAEPQWQRPAEIISQLPVPSHISLSSDLNGVEVYADMIFRKVFFELLDNSARHGGNVTSVRVTLRHSLSGMTIVWEDNGTGIPDRLKEEIFHRGYGKNSGLGLFLIREILGITGMKIKETGIEGNGARFEITVPKGEYRNA